jgi:DNA-binding NarL/FixJ family response regulator
VGGGLDVEFVGRDAELNVVVECIRRAASGAGHLVDIEGEAGIGKTRLIDEAIAAAGIADVRVLRGAGDELTQDRPFGPLLDLVGRGAIESITARPDVVLPDLRTDPGDRAWATVEAFVDAVESVSRDGPVVLAIDDLQWADVGTLRAIGVLARHLPFAPVALVLSRRPTPASRPLDDLMSALTAAGADRVRLGELDAGAVNRLVANLAGDREDELLPHVTRAGGNPFFLIELVTTLVASGDTPTGAPPSVFDTVLRRLGGLDQRARWLLGMASAFGSRFEVDELAEVSGESLADLLPALDAAVASGVLMESGDALAFRHDLVREALYGSMPRPLQVAVHRHVGRTLAATGRPAIQVAHHLAAGASAGDDETVAWLERAADEITEQAPGGAADLIGQAAALTTQPSDALRFRGRQVELLAWSGRLVEAEELARAVVGRLGDDELTSAVRAALASAMFFRGRPVDAAAECDEAAAAPGRERPLYLAQAALAHVTAGHLDIARERASEAEALARDEDHAPARALALCVLAAVEFARGGPTAAGLARDAVALAEGGPARAHRYGAHVLAGMALTEVDAFAEAQSVVERGMRRDAELGSGWSVPSSHWTLGAIHLYRGAWDSAMAELDAGLELAADMDFRVLAPYAYSLLAQIAVHRDDLVAAERALVAGEEIVARDGPQLGWERIIWMRARLARAAGDVDVARERYDMAWTAAVALTVTPAFRLLGPDLVPLVLAAGQRSRAAEVVERLEDAAATLDLIGYRGIALQCHGLLDADLDTLLAAVDCLRGGARVMELAVALEHAAVVAAQGGRAEDARRLADEASAVYDRVGAGGDAARLRRTLERLGVRLARPAPDGERRGLAGLSRQEHRVAELVAEGLTNKEIAARLFVSRRTVDNHLYRMFTKLGVSSRVELAVLMTRHP